MKCESCNGMGEALVKPKNLRVSIWGMYDTHLFHKYGGATVDEVIVNWLSHIAEPIPAMVGEKKVDDLGPTSLCPAIVLDGDKELRRVGEMVHVDFKTRSPRIKDVERYRRALKADPDIPRILATPTPTNPKTPESTPF